MANKAWRCRIGLHQWSPWEDTSVGLFPIGDRQALNIVNNFSAEGVDVETLALTTKHRECQQCGKLQGKQFINW